MDSLDLTLQELIWAEDELGDICEDHPFLTRIRLWRERLGTVQNLVDEL